jgi:hypothetical protein
MKEFLYYIKALIGRAPNECKRNMTLSSVAEMQVVFRNIALFLSPGLEGLSAMSSNSLMQFYKNKKKNYLKIIF